MSPGALASRGPGFPVGTLFPWILGIELKVHSLAQDGVLLSNGASSVCFLFHAPALDALNS